MFLWALKLKDCGAWYIWTTLPHTRLYVPFGGCKRGDFLLPWRHMHGIYTAFRLSLLFHIRSVHRRKKPNITSSAFLFLTSCGANFNICQKVCVSKCWYSLYVFIKYSKRLYHWLYYDTDSFHSISTYLYCVDYIGLIPIEPLLHFSRKTIWGAFGEISKY